jgi:hypothetical protein
MMSKDEYQAFGMGELLFVIPMEPGNAALAAGAVAKAPNDERRSIKTNPRLARFLELLRGLRSVIMNSSHP